MKNRIEIVTVDDEILVGNNKNFNLAWLGKCLSENGFAVQQITTIPSNKSQILSSVASAFNQADAVLLTGRVGIDEGDFIKECLCEIFCTELSFHEATYENVLSIMKNRADVPVEWCKRQAMLPKICSPILNQVSVMPVLWFERMDKVLIWLPGYRDELEEIMQNDVLPRMKDFLEQALIERRTLIIRERGAVALSVQIEKWKTHLPDNIRVALSHRSGYIQLRLTGEADDRLELQKEMDLQVEQIRDILGDNVRENEYIPPEKILTNLLQEKGLTISTAESCTGGTIASYLAKHPGSSAFYIGSVVAYCNEVKHAILGVEQEVLDTVGAVSQQTVEQMAKGVRRLLKTDIGISVSGIAGPGGGTKDKPVGTVWIAVADADRVVARKLQLGNLREKNIEKATVEAIFLAKEFVENKK